LPASRQNTNAETSGNTVSTPPTTPELALAANMPAKTLQNTPETKQYGPILPDETASQPPEKLPLRDFNTQANGQVFVQTSQIPTDKVAGANEGEPQSPPVQMPSTSKSPKEDGQAVVANLPGNDSRNVGFAPNATGRLQPTENSTAPKPLDLEGPQARENSLTDLAKISDPLDRSPATELTQNRPEIRPVSAQNFTDMQGLIPLKTGIAPEPILGDLEQVMDIEVSTKAEVHLRAEQLAKSATLSNPTAVSKAVAVQIAQSVIGGADPSFEITLDPIELGKLRLTLQTTETGITLQIHAERQETMDLMRRNSGDLEAEFESLGYHDINFEFSHNQNNEQQRDLDESAQAVVEGIGSQTMEYSDPKIVHLTKAAASGLDLRL